MLTELFSNPTQAIIDFLLALPGLLLALCAHEAAHGLVAYWCGDPTAKLMGRVTLNPARHLDPIGTVCMLLMHIGWAKPVPVNPNNFRHPRRDDFFVSIAGIAANLLLCVIGCALANVCLVFLLRPDSSETVYYLYQIALNLAMINVSLACFNLLPIPPLDGYHVVNDLILRNTDPFASARAANIGRILILAIVFVPQLSDLYSSLISRVFFFIHDGVSAAMFNLMSMFGVF